MPVRVTPDAGTTKWQNRTTAAVPDYVAGVNNTTINPMQKAASKKDKYVAGVQGAVDKWQRNTAAFPFDEWKSITATLGGQRIAAGVSAKANKYTTFAMKFYPYLDQGLNKISSMPDTTFEDRLQKMAAMARHNHDFKR